MRLLAASLPSLQANHKNIYSLPFSRYYWEKTEQNPDGDTVIRQTNTWFTYQYVSRTTYYSTIPFVLGFWFC